MQSIDPTEIYKATITKLGKEVVEYTDIMDVLPEREKESVKAIKQVLSEIESAGGADDPSLPIQALIHYTEIISRNLGYLRGRQALWAFNAWGQVVFRKSLESASDGFIRDELFRDQKTLGKSATGRITENMVESQKASFIYEHKLKEARIAGLTNLLDAFIKGWDGYLRTIRDVIQQKRYELQEEHRLNNDNKY